MKDKTSLILSYLPINHIVNVHRLVRIQDGEHELNMNENEYELTQRKLNLILQQDLNNVICNVYFASWYQQQPHHSESRL